MSQSETGARVEGVPNDATVSEVRFTDGRQDRPPPRGEIRSEVLGMQPIPGVQGNP